MVLAPHEIIDSSNTLLTPQQSLDVLADEDKYIKDSKSEIIDTYSRYLEDYKYNFSDDALSNVIHPTAVKIVQLLRQVGKEMNAGLAESPIGHLVMLSNIINPLERHVNDPRGFDNVYSRNISVCFRDSAKTAVLNQFLYTYLWIYNGLTDHFSDISVGIFVGDSIKNGVKTFTDKLGEAYMNSSILQDFLPQFKILKGEEISAVNNRGIRSVVKLIGIFSGIRGFGTTWERPHVCLMDDLLTDKSGASETQIESIKSTIDTGILGAMNIKKQLVSITGTPFAENDYMIEKINSGKWNVNFYPICEKFPCTEEEYVSFWPDRFPYSAVAYKYNDKENKAGFNREFMLRLSSEHDRLVHYDKIRRYTHDDYVYIMTNKEEFNWYVTTDLATTEAEANDDSVNILIAVDRFLNKYIMNLSIRKCEIPTSFDLIIDQARNYNLKETGVEISGGQGSYIALLQREAKLAGVKLNLSSGNGHSSLAKVNNHKAGINPIKDKFKRFKMLGVALFESDTLLIPEFLLESIEYKKMEKQLNGIATYAIVVKNDDVIDALVQIQYLNIKPGSGYVRDSQYFEEQRKLEQAEKEAEQRRIAHARIYNIQEEPKSHMKYIL